MREKLLTYLQSLQENNLTFFALSKSGEDEVVVMHQKDDSIHFKPSDILSYVVFNKYQNTNNQIFINNEVIKKFTIEPSASPQQKTDFNLVNTYKNEHVELVETAISTLKNTDLEKVVVSRKQDFSISENFETIYLNALDHYPSANVYFFHHPKVGTWIGATPETLLQVQENKLKTMSLAGTAVYREGEIHQWGNKEQEEQQIVTDYIMNQLQTSGCTEIHATAPKTAKAGSLIHLKSSITAQVSSDKHVSEVLNKLHPTPAVCGLPTQLAQQFIENHENYDREFYTGYFGIVDRDLDIQDYYVNLRCMKLSKNTATIYVGGGITASSNAEDEYQETVEKLKTMARLIHQI